MGEKSSDLWLGIGFGAGFSLFQVQAKQSAFAQIPSFRNSQLSNESAKKTDAIDGGVPPGISGVLVCVRLTLTPIAGTLACKECAAMIRNIPLKATDTILGYGLHRYMNRTSGIRERKSPLTAIRLMSVSERCGRPE